MSHWTILCLTKIYFSIETIKIIFLIVSDFDVKGSYGMLPNNNHEKKSRNDG